MAVCGLREGNPGFIRTRQIQRAKSFDPRALPNVNALIDINSSRISTKQTFIAMPPSLRFAHPMSTTPRPAPSTSLVPPEPPTSKNVPATPFDDASQSLRFNCRVPTAGMHSSNHSSDAMRTEIHLSRSCFINIDAFEMIEFDGTRALLRR